LEILTFTLSAPGANPGRQLAPHPHEALIDPTDSYIIVPDLGADLVRVFSVDPTTSLLTEATPLKTPPGTGPRHGVFLKTDCDTFFFLVFELGNTIASYKVTYGKKGLGFTKVFERSIYGPNATPTGADAAEVVISPDRRYLLTSSRNDSLFQIPNFNSFNPNQIPSDTLQVWKVEPETGILAFEQLAPAGGIFPRQFSLNKKGTLAAIGLQLDSRVVIIERNVEDGKFVAEIDVPGQITSVIWDD
jgi:6-phosphogluconolactonase (cycloisomerase 2 family)